MTNLSPIRLFSADHFGLVYLEDNWCNQACIVDLDDTAEHPKGLVFLEPWREFPKFTFIYLTEDIMIKGVTAFSGYPTTSALGQISGYNLSESTLPGEIVHKDGKEILWALDRDEVLVPLPLNTGGMEITPGHRRYQWWMLCDCSSGDFLPVAIVQSNHINTSDATASFCAYRPA